MLIADYRYPGQFRGWPLAVYDVAFVAAWLTRDVLCLQWMNLRRARRPLGSAALYIVIFYGCTMTLFGALNLYAYARSAALTAILVPSPLYALSSSNWRGEETIWLLALVAQCVGACFFWWLHQQRLKEFREGTPEPQLARDVQMASA